MKLPSIIAQDNLDSLAKTAADSVEGCFVEVGVFEGGSAQILYDIAMAQGRRIFLYDTFNGIPYSDTVDSHKVGDFTYKDVEYISRALPKAIVTQGIFPDSAIEMPPIAFCHLDVDQYWSYRNALDYLETKISPGGIIWFDDYGCTSGCDMALNERYGKGTLEMCGQKYYKRF